MNVYEKARLRHFYEIEYGEIPGDHQVQRLFAIDKDDAINKFWNIFPSAIIYEVSMIGR